MKTFLKQYFVTWLKFFVMTPGILFATLCRIICELYTLFTVALFANDEAFDMTMDDIIDWLK